MAENPSAPAASTGTSEEGLFEVQTEAATKQAPLVKPEKPDEATFKAEEAKKRKDLAEAQQATKDAQARVSSARPNNADSPQAKRQQELRAQLSAIRTKQQGFKSSRASIQERMKLLDSQLKSKIQEQKTAKSRIPFKSAEEIDREISNLEKQVDSGKMKLVDEKKTLADITSLRKQRKAFAGFDETQRSIDATKASLSEAKKELENPEFKSLSDEYTQITKELDTLKAEQDQAYKGLSANRDALTAARKHQDQCFQDLKQLQNEYYTSRRAFDEYERNARRVQAAKKRAEREAFLQARKKRDMEEELEAARAPAYADEIHSCDALIRLLDPSGASSDKTVTDSSQFAAVAQRFVDDSGIKGTKLSKKEDDDDNYFMGSGGKKSKKGKKGRKGDAGGGADAPAKPSDMGFYYRPDVAEHFDKVGIQQPGSRDDEPKVLEQIKTKRQWWKDNQAQKTQENVAAAQKRIDMMENIDSNKETANSAELNHGDNETEDVAKGLEKANISEESKGPLPEGAAADGLLETQS